MGAKTKHHHARPGVEYMSCWHPTTSARIPPSVKDIMGQWPDIIPDLRISRAEPRCYDCDLEEAAKEEDLLWKKFHVIPGAAHLTDIADLERELEELADDGKVAISEEDIELVKESDNAKRLLLLSAKNKQAASFLAYTEKFWGIWGRVTKQKLNLPKKYVHPA